MLNWLCRYGWAFVWFALLTTAYLFRHIFPVDETRYLSVAWEMWVRGDFLLPYLNGELYSHKPPMLFWLFQLGWSVFGVNEWWPRLVPPLFALGGLFLVRMLARQIWPQKSNIAILTPWILGSCVFWAIFTTSVMFDMLLMVMVLLAMLGIWRAASENTPGNWLIVGIACGLGMLIKGPVMMAHIFFPAVLAPWWSQEVSHNKLRWYVGLLLALLLATIIALCWLVPAIYAGGASYEQNILWHQSVDRAISSFAHNRPFWWYLSLVPFILFPWLVWPPAWRAFANLRNSKDKGIRFLLFWVLPTFVLFSLISGKQVHYLIPLFPPVALLLAGAINGWQYEANRKDQLLPALIVVLAGVTLIVLPELNLIWLPDLSEFTLVGWGVAIIVFAGLLVLRNWQKATDAVIPLALVSGGLTVMLMAAVLPVADSVQNVTPTAMQLANWQEQGKPIAHLGKYHGQFQFAGRLKKPLVIINKNELNTWSNAHPDGYVVTYENSPPGPDNLPPAFAQQYRNHWIVVWTAASIKEQSGLSN